MAKRFQLNVEEVIVDDVHASAGAYAELLTPRRAFFSVFTIAFMLAALVFGRVAFLGFAQGNFYITRAEANVNRAIPVYPYRAPILDRYGEPLTENRSAFSVFIDVALFSQRAITESALLVHELASILGEDPAALYARMRGADVEHENWIELAHNVSSGQAIVIRALHSDLLEVVDDYVREYVSAPAFAHIVGYTGTGIRNQIVGKAGIELAYDERIRGEPGEFLGYYNAVGEELETRFTKSPEAAPPLTLTVDADLQRYFYTRLAEGLRVLGRNSGVGIALNPQTGEILSLVNLPSFDSNAFVDGERRDELTGILSNIGKPLFNRAISGTYSPGSTIKPLVAVAALTEGVVVPETDIYSAGSLSVPNIYDVTKPSVFLDWKAHGWVNVRSALARSSNIYFYLSGGGLTASMPRDDLVDGSYNRAGLGIAVLKEYWQTFGLGVPTGVDLPFEAEGFLPDPEAKQARTGDTWRLGDTYNVSIGQGDLLVTPLQLLNVIAAIANGGTLYEPYLAQAPTSRALAFRPELRDAITVVQEGMVDAVYESYGTAHLLHDLPFTVAGKTGSAQTNNNTRTNALFVGYAPVAYPEIAILVLVENAKEGSVNTLPIAKDVLRWYYEHRIAAQAEPVSE